LIDDPQAGALPPVEPPFPPKKSKVKVIAVAVVAVVVVVALVAAMMLTSGPGLAGRWERTSLKMTVTYNGTTVVDWDNSTGWWMELNDDGTGITSEGDEFAWEASDGRITITEADFTATGIPWDYTLDGDELTVRGLASAGVYLVMEFERA
jgi:hypothetical protein